MGAAELDVGKLQKVVKIEAWAQECQKEHRKECSELWCGGKSKLWWMVRHPEMSPSVANDAAKKFAMEKFHCCAPLLMRLDMGDIPWLPKERRIYVRRTDEQIEDLLGRNIDTSISYMERRRMAIQEKERARAEKLAGKATDATQNGSQQTRETRAPVTYTEQHSGRRMPVQATEETQRFRNGKRVAVSPATGLQGTIDALSRRG